MAIKRGALGLATVCRLLGLRLVLVADMNLDPALRQRFEHLGARVDVVDPAGHPRGSQGARLDQVDRLLRTEASPYFVYQYARTGNRDAYWYLAALLALELPRIDCLVGTVGTGGSMCGTSQHLRRLNPHLSTVGIDLHGSVLFGQPERPRLIGGLGGSIVPSGLRHSDFDEVHWLSAGHACHGARDLHRSTGLYQGPTSGLAWTVASWQAQTDRARLTVALLPDEGHRYARTAYNDDVGAGSRRWVRKCRSHRCSRRLEGHEGGAARRGGRRQTLERS